MSTGRCSRRVPPGPDWSLSLASHPLCSAIGWFPPMLLLHSGASLALQRPAGLLGTVRRRRHQNCGRQKVVTHFNKLTWQRDARQGVTASYIFKEFLGDDASPGVDRQLHLADLLVDLLHEVDDEVHQLVFVHLLRVEVGDQEADVVSLK